MKRSTIVEIIAALFIILFLYTALSKSFEISKTIDVLNKTPRLSAYSHELAWAIVFLEYGAALLLFIPQTRKKGMSASLCLMVGFTFYILYMFASVPHLPCSCGGVISKMSWKQHLLFNILFVFLALLGILLDRKRTKSRAQGALTTIPIIST